MSVIARRPALVAITIGGLIGLAVFESSLGLELVRPGRIGWLMGQFPSDWTTHFLGWHVYRHEPWQWPLGSLRSLIYPIGTSIGLTDSIPAFAIPFKALDLLSDRDFQYIGLWILCSFVLQGVFGALLVRTRTSSISLQVLGAALFVLAPPLLARIGHTALTAHWLILGCLWVHFAYEPPQQRARAFAALMIFVGIAAAAHPYLTLMVAVLAAAYYARALVASPRSWLVHAVLPTAALAILCWIVFWQAGDLIVTGHTLQASGLGNFSSNVLSPTMAMGRSRFLSTDYFQTATTGQYEGYAYLGVGMMILGLVALVTAAVSALRDSRWIPRFTMVPLVLGCLVLAVLAFSPKITAGSTTILEYSEGWWGPLTQFRSSGRFIWPAYYAVMFWVVVTIATRLRYWVALTLLAACTALQAIDASPAFATARGIRTLQWRNALATQPFWTSALRHYRHLSLYPTHLCADPLVAIDYVSFAVAAGRAGVTLNAGSTSRINSHAVREYCRHQEFGFANGLVDNDTLYVMSIRLAAPFERRAKTRVACVDMDEFGVCFAKDTYLQWQDDFDVNLAVMPPIDELTAVRDVLDREYRDAMMRRPAVVYGSAADRARAIAQFVGYRLTGCDEQEAMLKIQRQLSGERELRLCTDHVSRRINALEHSNRVEQMPPRSETLRMLRMVQDRYRERSQAVAQTTHVDIEGEAVWLQEYIAHRLSGRSPTEAQNLVLAATQAAR